MSVELEPAELGFRRPFNQEVSQTLRLTNPRGTVLAFKVKTTAPKQYCVRPNSGTIKPNETVEVSVVLQPMKVDPAPDTRCKDKFLVQSVEIDTDENAPSWAEIEKASKSRIQERKIRVHYLAADESAPQDHGAEADSPSSPPPPVYTPVANSSSNTAAESKSRSGVTSSGESAGSAKPLTSSGGESSLTEQLRAQLAQANVTISQLKRDAESGLRQRNINTKTVSEGLEKAGQKLAPQPLQSGQTGVPLQTTALLCLFVFLITYFLF